MTRSGRILTFLCTAATLIVPAPAQNQLDKLQKDRARQMLKDISDGLRKNYYDPKLHGIDIDAAVKTADQRMSEATSLGAAFTAIAAFLDPLNDSHTFFVPPARTVRREFGYEFQMIGDRCFVTAVRPDGPAAEKLSPGDEILTWEGYRPTRDTLRKMTYTFDSLYVVPVHVLEVRSPGAEPRKVEITGNQHVGKRVLNLTGSDGGADIWQVLRDAENSEHMVRQRLADFDDKLTVWKMPEFDFTEETADRALKEIRKRPALVLDLRGNPGGIVKLLEYVLGGMMDHDVTISKRIGRKSDMKPQVAKARPSAAFKGKLIVLIDSRSASAAELFARVVQLEHRGAVLGDLSSGSVMESRYYPWKQGVDTQFSYGASITEADLIMADGKSLEHAGVTPDELIVPTPEDLAEGRDPVLARAAALADVKLNPVAAGKLFPIEWRKD